MKTRTEITINKNINAIWEVMGNQFAQVHLWSSNFKDSKAGGSPKLSGLNYAHRVTLTDRGETIQELDEFDAENYSLTYHITKGAPEIAKYAGAVWSLTSLGQNTTLAVFEFILEPQDFIKEEMLPKIEMGLLKSANEIAEELKYYMEENKAHPRKAEQHHS